jgi:hypothetical protein
MHVAGIIPIDKISKPVPCVLDTRKEFGVSTSVFQGFEK